MPTRTMLTTRTRTVQHDNQMARGEGVPGTRTRTRMQQPEERGRTWDEDEDARTMKNTVRMHEDEGRDTQQSNNERGARTRTAQGCWRDNMGDRDGSIFHLGRGRGCKNNQKNTVRMHEDEGRDTQQSNNERGARTRTAQGCWRDNMGDRDGSIFQGHGGSAWGCRWYGEVVLGFHNW